MDLKLPISKKINATGLKNVFKRSPQFTNMCSICKMEFTDAERTKKHMIKAHAKPKREKEH